MRFSVLITEAVEPMSIILCNSKIKSTECSLPHREVEPHPADVVACLAYRVCAGVDGRDAGGGGLDQVGAVLGRGVAAAQGNWGSEKRAPTFEKMF